MLGQQCLDRRSAPSAAAAGPALGDDIVRSIYARDRVRSNWMGYSKTGDALSDAAWRMVIKGMDSVWYWMWSGIGSWRGYLRPTLDFWPAIEDVKDEMQPVREGLGDLLLKSEMLDSGIAVFYSVPSALSGSLENSGSFASAEGAHNDFVNLTYELGRDVKYVTAAMLVDGELERGKYRVLLLPMAQALSPEEKLKLAKANQSAKVTGAAPALKPSALAPAPTAIAAKPGADQPKALLTPPQTPR